NSQQFYNGVSIGIYNAGYICYKGGKQLRMNDTNEPLILGKAYYPQNILITNEDHLFAIYDELLNLQPIKDLIEFFQDSSENIFPYKKEVVCSNLSTLFSFAQEVLEWSLVYEIANRTEIRKGDFILRDGTLRSLNIKQKYLVKLGKFLHEKGIIIVGITKNSPVKMELTYTLRQIDNYLQDKLKLTYPFTEKDSKRQKLCCWFEVPDDVLLASYGGKGNSAMYAKKDIKGGRGFGLFTIARLDYVEKLQNYDWVIADVNIFDAIPNIESDEKNRDMDKLSKIFKELTRLTQEHYILGYPYPLVEAHNFVSLKKDFKEEMIKRVKFALYKEQRMDNIEIENLFLDIHDKF
ncbi:MAG: DNA double-strand break repair nuclease NurA, partial [Candidatus Aenigmarchaeota archaeon]|nr:DNA double-strand break repair nuclease NurA [Candidatus Aenigmarchaeota archaeon]